MTNFEKVKEFHKAFGLRTSDVNELANGVVSLRMDLLEEEYDEVLRELEVYPINLKQLVKELADLLYVTYGFGETLGINMDKVFAEVHRSNMSKLGIDGKPSYREDGKVMKGPNYSPANLEGLI